jgi:shikimate dehydrogenase
MSIARGGPRLAGVLGWPVGHSLSPALHGHWFERHGVAGAYVPLPVRPEDLGLAFRALPRLGFSGWNVTVPHKEAAFRLVDERDPAATRAGAVNTVLVRADGSLLGRNTDGQGFLASLRGEAPSWRPQAALAVLLGAGGGARAVALALLDAGVPGLRLANRSRARAEELAGELVAGAGAAAVPVEVVAWEERSAALAGAGLLVNATSLGMAGQPPLEIGLDALPGRAVVADLVYVPLETGLLAAARARGNLAVDGLGMLLHQAVPGFAHWGGVTPSADDGAARARVLEALVRR